ncbi:MAG: hypothetical protein MZV63_54490 [Marinilabiliales bacterium]|nr:hypothetical protein [Marinilabiliales bacterium]
MPLSKFGLMQITRQRVRPEMTIITDETCPVCRGEGKTASAILLTDEIERTLVTIVEKVKTRKFILRTHPFVAAYLEEGLFIDDRQDQQEARCRASRFRPYSHTISWSTGSLTVTGMR